MTPLGRWLRRRLEKLLDRWADGPEPPARLGDMVVLFANLHPRATRAEWAAFAAAHAGEAYRTGYARGYEHVEREFVLPDPRPEVVADFLDPDWRLGPQVSLDDPGGAVEGSPDDGGDDWGDQLG